jgi:DNA-binding NarL/FixJ family response regulator
MTMSTFIHPFGPAGASTTSPSSGGGRVRRFVARHRLTDEERKNLADYYRHNPVQPPAMPGFVHDTGAALLHGSGRDVLGVSGGSCSDRDEYGEHQLTDFGIAQIAGGFETSTGVGTGSPALTAPEVLQAQTPASDDFSLGATLFCALTGHAAIAHAMACSPEDRHATVAELGDELRQTLRRSRMTVDDMAAVVARLRVVVAEDDFLFREGLASLLDCWGFDVVGQAGDGVQLLALVRDKAPDLVVADIRMPPTNTTEGLDAARVIREEFPDTGILMLSAHVDVEHTKQLLASGHGIGYLLKSRVTDVADFIDTLQRIANGASVVDPALVQELVSARRPDDPLAVLSAREQEVLALMAEGRSNVGIAHRIWVTESTVEKHVRSILTKLNLPETGHDHRRVLATITFLEAR